MHSTFSSDLNEIGDAYELESRKARVEIRRAFQVEIAVYQLVKLQMLEFYYDFLDQFIDCSNYELMQMDTDSNYLAISGERLEEVIKPELGAEFEVDKKQWLAWGKWSNRKLGLSKLECVGQRMIALYSKCYFVEKEENRKNKLSTKGMSKAQNAVTWGHFKAVLYGHRHGDKHGLPRDGRITEG